MKEKKVINMRVACTVVGELEKYIKDVNAKLGTPNSTIMTDLAFRGLQTVQMLDTMPQMMELAEKMAQMQNAQMKIPEVAK
jgi:hypothetical protein